MRRARVTNTDPLTVHLAKTEEEFVVAFAAVQPEALSVGDEVLVDIIDRRVFLVAREDGEGLSEGQIEFSFLGPEFSDLLTLAGDKVRLAQQSIFESDVFSAGVVVREALQDLAVDATKLAAGAVTTEKLVAGSVTTAKLAAESVTAAKLDVASLSASEAVIFELTAQNATIAGELIANSLTAGSITAEKIDVGSIDVNSLSGNTITAYNIDGVTITGSTVRSASSGPHVRLTAGDRFVEFFRGTNTLTGYIGPFRGEMGIGPGGSILPGVTDNLYISTEDDVFLGKLNGSSRAGLFCGNINAYNITATFGITVTSNWSRFAGIENTGSIEQWGNAVFFGNLRVANSLHKGSSTVASNQILNRGENDSRYDGRYWRSASSLGRSLTSNISTVQFAAQTRNLGNEVTRWATAAHVHASGAFQPASSTREVKQNIEDAHFNATDIVNKINPITFRFKENEKYVIEEDPEDAVRLGILIEDAPWPLVDPADPSSVYGQSYDTLLAMSIQELDKRISALEKGDT